MALKRLQAICDRFRIRLRALILQLAASRLFLCLVAVLILLIGIDWYMRFDRPGRFILLAVFLVVAAMGDVIGALRYDDSWDAGHGDGDSREAGGETMIVPLPGEGHAGSSGQVLC